MGAVVLICGQVFDGVSDADLHAIVAGNAAKVFGFDLAILS